MAMTVITPQSKLIAGTIDFPEDAEIKSANLVIWVSAIVEAQDENRKYLRSFVTGFLPFACTK